MDSKSYEALPATIYNLGSCAARYLDFTREELWARMSTPLRHKAVQIPVFLVNEAQMDILYPPERRKVIDPENAKDWRERRRNSDDPPKWQDLDPPSPDEKDPDPSSPKGKGPSPSWSRYERFVAIGLYVCNPKAPPEVIEEAKCKDGPSPTGVLGFSEAEEAYIRHEGPRIYLCCERIVSVAEEKGIDPNLVLDKVYYHELGHALLKGVRCFEKPEDDPYLQTWGRIIEESAAEWISYVHFRGRERLLFRKVLMKDKPAEYRSCVVFHRIPLFPLPMAEPNNWDENTQQGIRSGLRKFYESWMDQKFPWGTPGPGKSFYEVWMTQKYPWGMPGTGILPLVEGTLLEDWLKGELFYKCEQQEDLMVQQKRWIGFLSLPLWDAWVAQRAFFLFFGYPSWGAMKVTTNPKTLIRNRALFTSFMASLNLSAWRAYKELGAPREPEYVIPLEEFAAALINFSSQTYVF